MEPEAAFYSSGVRGAHSRTIAKAAAEGRGVLRRKSALQEGMGSHANHNDGGQHRTLGSEMNSGVFYDKRMRIEGSTGT